MTATVVSHDTYATNDGSYSVGYTVTHETKRPRTPYEVQIVVNGKVVTHMYFDHREQACRYATDSQMHLWQLRPILPAIPVKVFAPEVAPTRSLPTREAAFSLTTQLPDPPAVIYTEEFRLEAEARGYEERYEDDGELDPERFILIRKPDLSERLWAMDEVGCVSRHPAECRCGDCLTYLAGE